MIDFLSIDTIMVTVLGYPLSWLEFLGTASGLVCVWLTARARLSGWIAGIVNALLFFALFLQVGLYSDMLLQVFFLATSVYGLWRWSHPRTPEEENARSQLRISTLSMPQFAKWIALAAVGAAVLGILTVNLPSAFPALFPLPAAFPFADGLVASLSVCATFMMTEKKRECWWFWIAVDVLAAVLYALKGVAFLSGEYVVFGLICVTGIISWTKERNGYRATAGGVPA